MMTLGEELSKHDEFLSPLDFGLISISEGQGTLGCTQKGALGIQKRRSDLARSGIFTFSGYWAVAFDFGHSVSIFSRGFGISPVPIHVIFFP